MVQTELAVALGRRYNAQMISMVEHNQRGIALSGAVAAARELGVSLDWLTGLTDDPTPSAELTAVADGDEQQVNIVELAAAAGHGAVVDSERVIGRIAFRRSWLRQHGLAADQCSVIRVVGASMEPTLPDGCSILVNRAQHRPRDGRLFVVRTADGLIVKRAGGEGGDWVLMSDNPTGEWPPVPWPDDAEVVGEVRWAARTFA